MQIVCPPAREGRPSAGRRDPPKIGEEKRNDSQLAERLCRRLSAPTAPVVRPDKERKEYRCVANHRLRRGFVAPLMHSPLTSGN